MFNAYKTNVSKGFTQPHFYYSLLSNYLGFGEPQNPKWSYRANGKSGAGFTVIELIVTIAIIFLLLTILTTAFVSFRKNQALIRDTERVVSELTEARILTQLSKDNKQYGVHFSPSQIVRFTGGVYATTSTDNIFISLDNAVTISNFSLNGSMTDVIFDRVTGETQSFGSVTLSLVDDMNRMATVTISKLGLTDVE